MKGFISKALVTGAVLAGLSCGSGCYYRDYWDIVDPCWPEHYNCDARGEVMTPRVTQATNGLVLEQTVWNHYFETGTADLNKGVQVSLDRMARRRPMPVGDVFVQTAHDVSYDSAHPEQLALQRADLDARRMKAVQAYLAAARPDASFSLAIHDPGTKVLIGVEAQTFQFINARSAQGALRNATTQDVTQQSAGGGAGGQQQIGGGQQQQGQQPVGAQPGGGGGMGPNTPLP